MHIKTTHGTQKSHWKKRKWDNSGVLQGQKNPHNLFPLQCIFYIPYYLNCIILLCDILLSETHKHSDQTYVHIQCQNEPITCKVHALKNILAAVIWEEKTHIEFSEFSILGCKCQTTKSYRMMSLSQNLLSINLRAYFSPAFKQMANISIVICSLFILFLYCDDID